MNDAEADTLPSPPPDHETRIAALEARADEQHDEFVEFKAFLENKFQVLQDDIAEWFRRKREGVTNGGG